MEQKLFFVGLVMAAYTYGLKKASAAGKLNVRLTAALWHGLFCAAAAYIIMMIVAVFLENRAGAAYSLTKEQKIIWAAAVIIGALWGFFKMKRQADEPAKAITKSDLEWGETLYSAMLLASVVMYLFIQAFKIPSGSMRMTFLEGDQLFVNKFIYGFRAPYTKPKFLKLRPVERGDVVVFRFPSESPEELQCGGIQYGKDFIKRVIGLPGDKVEVANGAVIVNGKTLSDETYAQYTDMRRIPPPARVETQTYQQTWETRNLGRVYGEMIRDNFGPVTIPQGSYFMMGDNRDHSCDSRFWGAVPEENIKGKAWFIYWPPMRIRTAI